jgi:predicted small lipoprotein YifL
MRVFRSRPVLVGLLAAVLLAGCGQKGPLYLPDQKPQSSPAPPNPAARP